MNRVGESGNLVCCKYETRSLMSGERAGVTLIGFGEAPARANEKINISADCRHSVMQQTPEMVARSLSPRAATQHSEPQPPSPTVCGGMASKELLSIATRKIVVIRRLTITGY